MRNAGDPPTAPLRGFPITATRPPAVPTGTTSSSKPIESYFVEMRRYLKDDLGVKCPITGTIGLGPLGTESQSHMDFVDAHAYWDHPQFPHRPMGRLGLDREERAHGGQPRRATLWGLAATRVAGKPFTVTEYNHAAPNEWQAESCQ